MTSKPVRPFTSHVKMMTLTLVVPHPGRWFYQREIQLITKLPYTPVRAAVLSLQHLGLLTRRPHGNRQYYTVNRGFILYEEYKRIVFKTTGLADHLRWAVRRKPGELVASFIYGDYADGTETTETPVRYVVVGDLAARKVKTSADTAAGLTRKEMRPLHLTPREFKARVARKDPELLKILGGRMIFLTGAPADLLPLMEPHVPAGFPAAPYAW